MLAADDDEHVPAAVPAVDVELDVGAGVAVAVFELGVPVGAGDVFPDAVGVVGVEAARQGADADDHFDTSAHHSCSSRFQTSAIDSASSRPRSPIPVGHDRRGGTLSNTYQNVFSREPLPPADRE